MNFTSGADGVRPTFGHSVVEPALILRHWPSLMAQIGSYASEKNLPERRQLPIGLVLISDKLIASYNSSIALGVALRPKKIGSLNVFDVVFNLACLYKKLRSLNQHCAEHQSNR